jgi:hypothetical protein
VHAQFGKGKWLDLGTIEEIRPRHCFQIADSHMRRQITGISCQPENEISVIHVIASEALFGGTFTHIEEA